ncbi:MAG: NifU family protein [Candidatus Kryptoniota bacterium]
MTEEASDDSIRSTIEDVLEDANKFLSIDGGKVSYAGLDDDGILRVRFHGSCAVCPLLPMTLRAGVERAVLLKVGKVRRVELSRA